MSSAERNGNNPLPDNCLSPDTILHGLAPEIKGAIRIRLGLAHFQPGQIMMERGEEGLLMYLIARGSAGVYIPSLEAIQGFRRVATIHPGEVAGEMALIDRTPRSATVIADSRVMTYTLDLAAWGEIQELYPNLAVHIKEIARARKEANTRR